MDRYQSHKIVEAGRIEAAQRVNENMLVVVEGGEEFIVSQGPIMHKDPFDLVCGYLVRYSDGYMSWSPAEAFEEGYTKTDLIIPTKM